MSAIRDTQTQDGWRLRATDLNDIDGLHALAGSPLVYRYLFDGVPPDRGAKAKLWQAAFISSQPLLFEQWQVSHLPSSCFGLSNHLGLVRKFFKVFTWLAVSGPPDVRHERLIKEGFGIRALLIRSLFGGDILRSFVWRVSPAKATSASSQY